jgi:hypothetical protein
VLGHVPARLEVRSFDGSVGSRWWVVLEDLDTAEVRTTDRQGPDHDLIVRVAVAFNELLRSRGAVSSFAADVRRHLVERGFVDVSSSGHFAFDVGGSGFAQVLAANGRQVAGALIAPGITNEDLDRYFTVLDDPTTVIGSPVLITTCARRAI